MVNFHAGIGKNLFCGAFILLSTAPYLHSDFVIDIDFQHIALIQLLQGLGLTLFIMSINAILLSALRRDEIVAGSWLAAQIAFNDISYALAGVFLLAIVLVWFAKPPFGPKAKP